MSDQQMVPSTADPEYVSIMTAMIRGVLQILSGFGFTWALTVSGSQIEMAATATVMLVTLVWSGWQKLRAAKAKHEAAIASAARSAQATMEAGAPVAVPVQPKATAL